jgi:hypothetical protein
MGSPLSPFFFLVLRQIYAAKGQRGGADTGPQPGRVKVIGLPAESHAEPVERTDELLGLGTGKQQCRDDQEHIYGHLFAQDRASVLEAMNQAVSRLYAYEIQDPNAAA